MNSTAKRLFLVALFGLAATTIAASFGILFADDSEYSPYNEENSIYPACPPAGVQITTNGSVFRHSLLPELDYPTREIAVTMSWYAREIPMRRRLRGSLYVPQQGPWYPVNGCPEKKGGR